MSSPYNPSRVNPYAPPGLSGVEGRYPDGYVDVFFQYQYVVSLLANQMLRDQTVSLATDADFIWRAIKLTQFTGAFVYRFSDSQGYYFSNAMLVHLNLLYGGVAVPFPVFPELALPAGGRIGIDIQDTSGAPNNVTILFVGVKRYRL